MIERVKVGELEIAKVIYELVEQEIAPGTGVDPKEFWQGAEQILKEFSPRNKVLLAKRKEIQSQMDEWYKAHRDTPLNLEKYKEFLVEIGYLLPEGEDFKVTTQNVDPEIATIAGPQLVVPVMNARYALNAANARWGSLYDALYGTDMIPEEGGAEKGTGYNPVRGEKVVAYAADFLDQSIPLASGQHRDVTQYKLKKQGSEYHLVIQLADGNETSLQHPAQFVGFQGENEAQISALLFKNNNLHLEIQIDASNIIGKTHAAGVKDVYLESAITTIQDCEDSVAAVDAEDKAVVYSNWLGLMQGTLKTEVVKGGKTFTRRLTPDRKYQSAKTAGLEISLPGRSLLLVRNVGHLMTNDAVLFKGEEVPEGILDGLITALISMHDLKSKGELKNSRSGSVYIVKPKMHGPEEVLFAVDLFAAVEKLLGISPRTLKIGIMDEERRTTVNLKACIGAAKDRVIFINTGFLDRTGDEIHTSMEAGPFVPKADMKAQAWISAYENWNVDIGLETGLQGVAQIGKGMWPKPDEMAQMMETKVDHPKAGANCAWVPSPTAATLHVMHYHQVNVAQQQIELCNRPRASLDDILTIPLLGDRKLSAQEIERELENNAQGILGYVVRWIDQGVGCSKVPDINDVGLMEDRATLRISSQHIANWLHQGICSEEQVIEVMKKMAEVVDRQNTGDTAYENMAPNFDSSIAFQAALELVIKGSEQPNGYTEPVLHAKRIEMKSTQS